MKVFKLILLFLINISLVQAQSSSKPNKVQLSYNDIKENVVLISDKTLYASNEVLSYKATYLCSRELGDRQWSRVLYVELIDENGNPLVQDKIKLGLNGAANKMLIPANAPSGVYYLKAYTQWMRNHFVDNYGLLPVAIINPNESISSDISNNTDASAVGDESVVNGDLVEIKLKGKTFSKRDTVNLEIVYSNDNFKNYDHCLTVVRKGTLQQNKFALKEQKHNESQVVQYLPDFYGLNLSGKLLYKDSQLPYKSGKVYISALNNKPFMGGVDTNEKGEFLFSLPYAYNETDFYLSTNEQNIDIDIRTNRGFCAKQIAFEKYPFNFDKSLVDEFLINQQLKERFNMNETSGTNSNRKFESAFYGSARKTYYPNDFVELPSLEEFFFEIVTDITVFYTDKEPAIRAAGWNAFSSSPFLLMIDNIPVLDIHKFLEIKTSVVGKIEIVNESYVLGDLKYAGIINVFSKQNDFAGMELPRNYTFISYDMLKPSLETIGESTSNEHENAPDFRNCLYWNPCINPEFDSSSNLRFTTSDITGEFEVIVFSVSKLDGKKQMNKVDFVVK